MSLQVHHGFIGFLPILITRGELALYPGSQGGGVQAIRKEYVAKLLCMCVGLRMDKYEVLTAHIQKKLLGIGKITGQKIFYTYPYT